MLNVGQWFLEVMGLLKTGVWYLPAREVCPGQARNSYFEFEQYRNLCASFCLQNRKQQLLGRAVVCIGKRTTHGGRGEAGQGFEEGEGCDPSFLFVCGKQVYVAWW